MDVQHPEDVENPPGATRKSKPERARHAPRFGRRNRVAPDGSLGHRKPKKKRASSFATNVSTFLGFFVACFGKKARISNEEEQFVKSEENDDEVNFLFRF